MDWKCLGPRTTWLATLGIVVVCHLSSALAFGQEDGIPDKLRDKLQRLWDEQAPASLGQGRPADAEELY